MVQPPVTAAVQFSVDGDSGSSLDSCCTHFSDEGLSLIKGPVQNVGIAREKNSAALPM